VFLNFCIVEVSIVGLLATVFNKLSIMNRVWFHFSVEWLLSVVRASVFISASRDL
jgi:hypothetical protein